MKYKNILDMHVHTDNSFDGNHSTMYMCEKACDKGLRAVAFTDHIAFIKKNFINPRLSRFLTRQRRGMLSAAKLSFA